MRIVNPSVELWLDNNDWEAHVAKCARICYASDKTSDNHRMIQNLYDRNHKSMFRHRSHYFIVPEKEAICNKLRQSFTECPYIEFDSDFQSMYISTNGHFILDHKRLYDELVNFEVDPIQFQNTPIGWGLMRYTFKVVTQISTSRELNRVSPNNIAEQSTRYVNFVKKELYGAICCPHWMAQLMGDKKEVDLEFGTNAIFDFTKGDIGSTIYLNACELGLKAYNDLINYHDAIPQDARGVLPLDTLTICAYTYSIREWRAIIDLRYYGTTGKPHPNAKIIAGMIRDKLIDYGYDFR